METKSQEVYSLMIPTIRENILLPNSNVAEILPFSNVELFDEENGNPSWFLGHLFWRGQEIPLVSIDVIRGETDPQANKRSRIAVTHTLNQNRELPYIAIVVQGIPRLSYVREDNIKFVEEESICEAEKMYVSVDDLQASIPDLDKLEELILTARETL